MYAVLGGIVSKLKYELSLYFAVISESGHEEFFSLIVRSLVISFTYMEHFLLKTMSCCKYGMRKN